MLDLDAVVGHPATIGVAMAVVGNLAISAALNIQKYAHLRGRLVQAPHSPVSAHAPLLAPSSPRMRRTPVDLERGGWDLDRGPPPPTDGATIADYTSQPLWWAGVVLMLLGETGNFMAYGFAPASVIAPLGTVTLVSNAIIAPTCLGETFRRRDLVGMILAVVGTVLIVTSSKSTDVPLDPAGLLEAILTSRFLAYVAVTTSLLALLFRLYSKYHKKTVFVDLSLVAIFGGWTVISTKAISTLLNATQFQIFTFPIFYPLLVIMIGTGILQINTCSSRCRPSSAPPRSTTTLTTAPPDPLSRSSARAWPRSSACS
ncbi:hypothetical protein, variant [Allomyces macrogynus ATCC 38327]|uniref:Uncharacterized protein n=1 Tax=Allomyces macrogynus (strain ATCC 38327) TaxID=578462 RepID=A0A0L0SZ84_ALLM3|nr:hypothetical protein, variant [Allomyces macrogynus ATCC 38327]|eukprot:KNE67624.1 hypothetical protein, variant [Allomyces macrogynus ATCC 38327]